MRGGKPVLLPKWWSPPGPESESAPGPESESEAGSGLKKRICRYANFWLPLQTRCRTHAAALLAFVMGEALGSRPVPGTPSGKRSAGTHRAVRIVCMPSERTARAAQLAPLQRSPPAQSEDGGSAAGSAVAESRVSLRRRAARRRSRSTRVEVKVKYYRLLVPCP